MQLKRDIDYSLRILLCVVQQKNDNGMTVFELSRHTSVPSTIVSRLCSQMTKAKFLMAVESSSSNKEYTACQDTLSKTLLDVIQMIEGTNSLFSVFDKSSNLYANCKSYFEEIEQQFSASLKEITIKDLKRKYTAAQ